MAESIENDIFNVTTSTGRISRSGFAPKGQQNWSNKHWNWTNHHWDFSPTSPWGFNQQTWGFKQLTLGFFHN